MHRKAGRWCSRQNRKEGTADEMEQRDMRLEPREEVSLVTSKWAANGFLQGTPCPNLNQDRTRQGGLLGGGEQKGRAWV